MRANPLREAVKARFYPFAESRGFARARSTHPHFTTFRRVQGDTVHVFDVQWDKYGRPAFVINFAEAVRGASLKDVETEDCEILLRLQPSKHSPRWWKLVKPWREILRTGRRRYAPAEVVDQAIAAFQEMEDWWTTRVEGAHVAVMWRRADHRIAVPE